MASYLRVTSNLAAEQPVLYSKFGIVGDGKKPDDAGVASLVAALNDFGTVELHNESPLIITLTEPARLNQRAGVTLRTSREPNLSVIGGSPVFRWAGEEGGDMLVIDRTLRATLDGFIFETNDLARLRAVPARAIVLDGGQDTGPGQAIGGSCTLRNLRHLTYPNASGKPGSATATTFITIAQATKMNQEFHEIAYCGGNGNGRGRFLYIGPSYNAKNIKLRRSWYIDHYDRAVQMDNGSLKLEDNNMSLNEWDLWLASTSGSVREIGHIGEGSRHHAFLNVPYYGVDNTFDIQNVRTRGEMMPDPLFPAGDPNAHEIPEAWILFGPGAVDTYLAHGPIEAPPRDANGKVKDTRVFGWMNDNGRRTELGPFALGFGHTRRTLGIDDETLSGESTDPGFLPHAGRVLFHDRPHEINPNGVGVLDLPTGELDFGGRGVTVEAIPDESQLPPERRTVAPTMLIGADGKDAAEAAVVPGGTVLYRTDAQLRYHEHRQGDDSRRTGTVGTSAKDK